MLDHAGESAAAPFSHSVQALIVSSPARYNRAAEEAARAGFKPELVLGEFGHASRCLKKSYLNNASRPYALSHILHKNTVLNMIEGFRKAYKIVVQAEPTKELRDRLNNWHIR